MREPSRRTIDGENYIFIPLPAMKAFDVFTFLTKVVGKPLLMLAARGLDKFFQQKEVDMDVALLAVESLMQQLNQEETRQTVFALLSEVHLDRKDAPNFKNEVDIDVHFAGRILHMMKVLQASIEENYRDFFDELRSQRLKAPSKA